MVADRGYSCGRVARYPDINPVTRLDYPDPDVIRDKDTYYMVSTTLHFMPGCEILRSYDLRNWEHLLCIWETGQHAGPEAGGRGEYLRQRDVGGVPALP